MNKKQKVLDSRIISFYTNEAARCMKSGASFASCIMLSSLLEYVLRTIYDSLPESNKKKELDLISLISFAQLKGLISNTKINKHFDTINMARDFLHNGLIVKYFENNAEPPKFDIKVSQVLASSVSEALKNLASVLTDEST